MKFIFTLAILSFCTMLHAQTPLQAKVAPEQCNEMVSFTTRVKADMATKDGAYMNGYVVNISHDELERLNGKKVRVTGEVTVVGGVPKDIPVTQGRMEAKRHLLSPSIEVLGKERVAQ